MNNSFSNNTHIIRNMDPFAQFRRLSKGFMKDAPARLHPNILVGAGCMLTPAFALKHRITHVINCASDCDSAEWVVEEYASNYTCIYAVDSINNDITNWYDEFELTLSSFLRSPECNTVYIHCQAGINRSAFLTLLYCCTRLHYNFDKTCKSMLVQRPCALTNFVYYDQVKTYIKNRTCKE